VSRDYGAGVPTEGDGGQVHHTRDLPTTVEPGDTDGSDLIQVDGQGEDEVQH
jgi:hypothetical protein